MAAQDSLPLPDPEWLVEAREKLRELRDRISHPAPRRLKGTGAVYVPWLPPARRVNCTCCQTPYVPPHWVCCGPPAGTRGDVWLGRWCKTRENGGCGRCPDHCICPKPEKSPSELFCEVLDRAGDELEAKRLIERAVQKIAGKHAMPDVPAGRQPGEDTNEGQSTEAAATARAVG